MGSHHRDLPTMSLSCIALIPARAGSKRIPGKNSKILNGHPLIAYAIHTAIKTNIFADVVVSTNSSEIAEIAKRYGANVSMRPDEMAGDQSPDIDWVKHALEPLTSYDCFSILRPTSPFRSVETIHRAWQSWIEVKDQQYDSLRAVELCSQHPGKMWTLANKELVPLLTQPQPVPWHSQQYAALPTVYVQNACLEIAWVDTVMVGGSIAGNKILPFITQGVEGFDLNTPLDWELADRLIESGVAALPTM